LWSFVDHGPCGTGEPLSVLLRPGNAGSNTATDHVTVIREALRQLPGHRRARRAGRKVLSHIDGAGATHELLDWLVAQRLSYSAGFTLPDTITEELLKVPEQDWQTAYDADGEPRPGAWVLEVTGLLTLTSRPKGMRSSCARNAPTPGAQLRIADADGNRITAFATNTAPGGPGRQLADLELRHRRRARAEDRIRVAKDTGLSNLPLHDLDQNRIPADDTTNGPVEPAPIRTTSGELSHPSAKTTPAGRAPTRHDHRPDELERSGLSGAVRSQRTMKWKDPLLPLSTYSARGGLRQDPGRAAESPAEARSCGNGSR
jgi:hypothetical protein